MVDRGDKTHDEALFGDLPHIPHSSWRHDHFEDKTPPARRLDAAEFWERLGL